ncbi:hypothetical protein RhiJN_05487 [Ceratobasidium sp. AG-Ba]|nr:hypothetical protein RhiJN_05487 [Ceratobasidium sp. AG-Ba]QRW06414.1 hypothetical protein RhiLY_05413 [Ceratobasidium sp. AG-Ba]
MMERRRTGANRAPTTEIPAEHQVWQRTQADLQKFVTARNEDGTVEKVSKTNRYINKFPASDDVIKTQEILNQFKDLKAKLSGNLESTKAAAEKEVKILDDALEHLSILLALRRSSDTAGAAGDNNKRTKRIRLSSPAQHGHSPSPAPASSASGSSIPKITVRLPTRSVEREKAGGALREGRRVAFHPPKVDDQEVGWILGLVTKSFIQNGKQMYEIQDADTETPRPPYITDMNSIIPLPDPSAPMGSPAHPASYPEYPPGTDVMAIYVSTTSFYRAVVVAGPKDTWVSGRTVRKEPQYKLKFEEDGDKVHSVNVSDIVERPSKGD